MLLKHCCHCITDAVLRTEQWKIHHDDHFQWKPEGTHMDAKLTSPQVLSQRLWVTQFAAAILVSEPSISSLGG